MRTKIAAANWKMNLSLAQATEWVADFKNKLDLAPSKSKTEVVIACSFPYIHAIATAFEKYPHVHIAGQNCHHKESGAFTGEVSAQMLKDVGAEYVILGHSERRLYFHESGKLLREKVDMALASGLKVIFCCGEDLETRNKDQFYELIEYQLEDSLLHLPETQIFNCVIAYEPVWAIGTGKNATPQQAQSCHHFIRKLISSRYNPSVADKMTILYGGSCNAANAASLFSQPDIDGGLVGGASLKSGEFSLIYRALDTKI